MKVFEGRVRKNILVPKGEEVKGDGEDGTVRSFMTSAHRQTLFG
jgi:hypothetical protein